PSRIAQQWLVEGEAVLDIPIEPTLPYLEEGVLMASDIMALGYRLDLLRGQQLVVEAASRAGFLVFADLYQEREDMDAGRRRLASADSTGHLTVDIVQTGAYLLRIQPEILAEGSFRLSIRTRASLVFPVSGHSSADVQSFWGDARDGGRRDHHGVDIFAPRGTPVVAVRAGTVTRVRETGIGGKQVWLRDAAGHNYYYAHLDEQRVRDGQHVAPGDTLGTVGNTGNARSTPPHLHFGIYQRGPHDPWAWVHNPRRSPSRVLADSALFGTWRTLTADGTAVRRIPSDRIPVAFEAGAALPVHVIGGTADWYHVRLADGRSGYVPASRLRSAPAADRPAGAFTPRTLAGG
ncbi:MAG: peptidoglycan DD-metalloendopeptidase family protein, partial [Bacteroidetes bacterium]|nr:peptidoglycan DD-metalloendopeptidase family protein [Bacteroidota bacterium]